MQLNVEKILRKVTTADKIFRGSKRVKVIKAVDCVMALSKLGMDAQTIKDEINALLESYKLVRVKPNEKNSEIVDLFATKSVNASDLYMWSDEKYDFSTLLVGISVIILIFSLVMFKAWPTWLQKYALYIRFPLYAILALYVLALIVRCVVYVITRFTHPPGLWIWPNFLADCGFFESLTPAYAWDTVEDAAKSD